MIIETKRLILRPWREEDKESLYKYASSPEVGPAAGWPAHESAEDSLNVLKNVLIKPNTWAVTVKGSDEPVGSIGCFPSDCSIAGTQPEIGYWIGKPFWGNAYIPEAVMALIARCFEEGAESVWCGHFAGNDKSRRVIEKCGFGYVMTEPWQREGSSDRRDTLYYRIDKEAWKND